MDDIAKRHPEFAEHLKFGEGDFPQFRSHLRDRRGGEGADPSGSSDPFEEYSRRFADRPFPGGFERFPFGNRGFEEREFGPSHFHQQPQQEPQQQEQQKEEAPPRQQAPVQERKFTNPTLIQSNTVDLGQKQDPVDDKRNQRSMSAPPENRNPQQRFVSTCNIPVNPEAPEAKQEQPKPHQSRCNERVIPIHVEGRDVPVVPKNVQQTFTPPPQPQPERVFGHKPSHFTQFLNRDAPNIDRPFGSASPAEDMFRQPYFGRQPQSPPGFQRQQAPAPQQQKQPPPTQPQPQEKPAPPPQQQQQPKTAIDHIQAVQKDVLALMDEVEKFNGKYRDKQYLFLDEMLTRNLLKLDNIDTEGKDSIRTARKEAIKCIQKCISILEAKAAVNSPELQQQLQQRAEEKMELEQAQEQPADDSDKLIAAEQQQTAMEAEPIKSLEVSGIVKSGTQANVPAEAEVASNNPKEEQKAASNGVQQQQMEVDKRPEEESKAEVKQQEAIPLPPPPEYREVQAQEGAQAVNAEAMEEAPKEEEKPKEKKKGKKKEKAEKK